MDVDSSLVLILNKIVGKSPLIDRSVELVSDTFILHGILFVALLWLFWFKDKREESRIRLLMGGLGILLTGPLSRLLQVALTIHCRPLHDPALSLRMPIGVEPSSWDHWNSFPSDHAALFFALATLIWISHRRLGAFAFLWAAIASSTRIYLGYHYPSDILGGAVVGIFMVLLFQRVPIPQVTYRLLDWERSASSSFYATAFLASYQAGTLFNDFREIGYVIGHFLLRHPV
jgi:undecaprenyl-diphosphatase